MMALEVDVAGIFEKNDTYDYDENYDYKDDSEHRTSTAVWMPLLYLALLLTGLLGNGLLLTILYRKWRSWSVTDIFVLHLCIADLLLLLTLPVMAAQAFQRCGWCDNLGLIPCKISRVLFYVNFYCGIFLLLRLVLDRYLFFCRATKFLPTSRPCAAHVTCLCVWISSLVLVIPKWIFEVTLDVSSDEKKLCVEKISASSGVGQLASRLLHHTLGFLLPAAALIICCSCVALRLHSGSKQSHKRRAFTVVLWWVVVFLLCWTPYNITLIVDTIKSRAEEPGNSPETALMATSLFGYAHACLRPLLHLSLRANFRTQALALVRCSPAQPVGSLWELGVGEDEQMEQNHKEDEQEQMTTDIQMQSSAC